MFVDSDVNDPAAAYASNDTLANAQVAPNPVTIGGFASAQGSGIPGSRFGSGSGDRNDYYRINLVAGQVIQLTIANAAADLDLFLLDEAGMVLAASMGRAGAGTETVRVPDEVAESQDLFVHVAAVSGASAYTLAVGLATAPALGALNLEQEFVPDQLIVRFRDGPEVAAGPAAAGMTALGGAPGRDRLLSMGAGAGRQALLDKLQGRPAHRCANAVDQRKLETMLALKAMYGRSDVVEARLNYIRRPSAVPNDPSYPRQWHYSLLNLPQAWDITQGSPDVVVAVVDTGVLVNHPDLAGQLVAGYDFIADAQSARDGDGIDPDANDPGDGGGVFSSSFHGTHVAGTIAAATDNGIGVAGVAWNVKIMPIRVLGVGGGTDYDIEQGVRYAAGLPNDSGEVPERPADIINLSLGGPATSTTPPEAFVQAREQGVIIVGAAGNSSSDTLFTPAGYDGVVSVSAVDMLKRLARYSNFGSTIDVAAPGGDMSVDLDGDGRLDGILSTVGQDSSGSVSPTYVYYNGTSMAAPHVAGVIALMKSVYPAMTPAAFDQLLASGALTQDLGEAGRDNLYGHGLIDANQAVIAAQVAASGGTVPDNPIMAVSPVSVNFGTSLSTVSLDVRNGGSGALRIVATTENSSGWLSITPAEVDADGLGRYTLTVDRGALADRVYTATVTLQSSANTVTIPVIMQVASTPLFADTGPLYVFLLHESDPNLGAQSDFLLAEQGNYSYRFTNVSAGNYSIVAGSDLDNDGFVCGPGEACGAYPVLDGGDLLRVEVTGNVNSLDFTTSFNLNATGASGLSESGPVRRVQRRLAPRRGP